MSEHWKSRYDLNRLSKEELIFEIACRAPKREKSLAKKSVDELRKELRTLRHISVDQSTVTSTISSKETGEEEFSLIASKFDEIEALLQNDNLELSDWDSICTKYMHYSLQVSLFVLQDDALALEGTLKDLKERSKKIAGKISHLYTVSTKKTLSEQELADKVVEGLQSSLDLIERRKSQTEISQYPEEEMADGASAIPNGKVNNYLVNSESAQNPPALPPRIQTDYQTGLASREEVSRIYETASMIAKKLSGPKEQISHRNAMRRLREDSPQFASQEAREVRGLRDWQGFNAPNAPEPPIRPHQPVPAPTFPNNNYIKIKTPTANAPTFDGSGDVENFLANYNRAAKLNGWTDQLKVHYLPFYLVKEALQMFDNNLAHIGSWQEVEDRFVAHYTPFIGQEEVREQEMRVRVQDPTESVENYFQEKLKLINKVDSNMAESKKMRLVLMGLAPDVLAKVVIMENNHTLEGLRLNIKKVEGIEYLINAQRKVQHPRQVGLVSGEREISHISTSKDIETQKMIKDLQQQVKELQFANKEKPTQGKSYNNYYSNYRNNEFPKYNNRFPNKKFHNNNNSYNTNRSSDNRYPPYRFQNHHGQNRNEFRNNFKTGQRPEVQGKQLALPWYNTGIDQEKREGMEVRKMDFSRKPNGNLNKCFRCGKYGHMARFCRAQSKN